MLVVTVATLSETGASNMSVVYGFMFMFRMRVALTEHSLWGPVI